MIGITRLFIPAFLVFVSCREDTPGPGEPGGFTTVVYSVPITIKERLLTHFSAEEKDHRGIASLFKLAGIRFEGEANTGWVPEKNRLYFRNTEIEIKKLEQLFEEIDLEFERLPADF